MSYGVFGPRDERLRSGGAIITCDPPLVVRLNGERHVWDMLVHTCDLSTVDGACLACSYRDCPTHHPSHYNPDGCPDCKEVIPR